ncbi:hypothetical protein JCM21900_006713 [Sporobolomyces salmonicolor]
MVYRVIASKAAVRSSPLFSFIVRESPSSLPASADALPTAFAGESNPFAPSKSSPLAKRWTAPKYSLRRQKMLRREAEALGLPDDVLPPPFVKASSPAAAAAPRLDPSRRLFKSTPHIPKTKILDELAMEKRGPYAGRKGAAFKGKMWERKKEERLAELKKLLDGADAKAEAWKKAQSEARAKAKPALPF